MKEIIAVRFGDRIGILVDDEDYEKLNKYVWSILSTGNIYYAHRQTTKEERANGYPNAILMHRQVLEVIFNPSIKIDHRNTDGLDNRKENLRAATESQNGANVSKRDGCTSKYKGVYWNPARGRWSSTIGYKHKTHYVGHFTSEEEAARAYDRKAKELFGEYAKLNFLEQIKEDNGNDRTSTNNLQT